MLAGFEAQLHRRPTGTILSMAKASPDDLWTRKSWIESANESASGFPLQSLPYCAFAAADQVHLGVGIGRFVLDLHHLNARGLLVSLDPRIQTACLASQLNELMQCGTAAWSELREFLISLLRDDASANSQRAIEPLLSPAESAHFVKPVVVGDYTDFYASIHHATNVGKLFRPDQPLLPNYKWIPIGYHGRASSLVVSGTEIRRPHGQIKQPNEDAPKFLPTKSIGLRTRSSSLYRDRQPPRRTNPHRFSRRSHLRAFPAQRLVGSRHSVMGISAARPLSRQELCHERLSLGNSNRGFAAISNHSPATAS